MIDKDIQAYHTYRRFVRTLLTICGCWFMPSKLGTKSTYYWSVCVFFFSFMYTIISLRVSYINRYNLVVMMKYSGRVAAGIGVLLKVGTFMIDRGSLINYHQTLNDLFEEELVRNEKIQKIMISTKLGKICMLSYIQCITMAVLAIARFIPSYLFIIRYLRHFHHLSTNYTLPLSKRYGYLWPVPDNFLYHLHLLFETGIATLSGFTGCSVDIVFGFYVYQLVSTLNAMTFRLTNPLPTEKFSALLKTCVAKHQKLLQCCNTLERTFRIIILWYFVTNTILLCALIYEITLITEFHVSTFVTFLTFTFLKLLQSFTYAWCGTVLTNAGEDFRKGVYFSEWPNSGLDRHVRTNVILMLMQNPMNIYAFFSPINVVMFTNFINTTVSYFFLLRSIDG